MQDVKKNEKKNFFDKFKENGRNLTSDKGSTETG